MSSFNPNSCMGAVFSPDGFRLDHRSCCRRAAQQLSYPGKPVGISGDACIIPIFDSSRPLPRPAALWPGNADDLGKYAGVTGIPILVLATVAARGSFVLSASAFAPPPPPIGGPPPGGPAPGGLPRAGLPGGGLPRAGLPGGGRLHAGPPRGGNLGGRAAAGNVAGSLRGGSGGARFSGRNTFNSGSYSSARSGSYSGSDYGRSGRYGLLWRCCCWRCCWLRLRSIRCRGGGCPARNQRPLAGAFPCTFPGSAASRSCRRRRAFPPRCRNPARPPGGVAPARGREGKSAGRARRPTACNSAGSYRSYQW